MDWFEVEGWVHFTMLTIPSRLWLVCPFLSTVIRLKASSYLGSRRLSLLDFCFRFLSKRKLFSLLLEGGSLLGLEDSVLTNFIGWKSCSRVNKGVNWRGIHVFSVLKMICEPFPLLL